MTAPAPPRNPPPLGFDTFILYGKPNADDSLVDTAVRNLTLGTTATARRVAFITEGASGRVLRTDIAYAVAVWIDSHAAFGPTENGTALWWYLDMTSPQLECFGGKTLAGVCLTMIGIPRNFVKTRNVDEGCVSFPSTDHTSGLNYSSDCTQMEIPEPECSGFGLFGPLECLDTYGFAPHPTHPIAETQPTSASAVPGDDQLKYGPRSEGYPEADNPGENFFKILSDQENENWYYQTVKPVLYIVQGSGTDRNGQSGDELDRWGCYCIMGYVQDGTGFTNQYFRSNGHIFDAAPFP